jgi:hypothetical protein
MSDKPDAAAHGRRSAGAPPADRPVEPPADPRNPGDAFLQREIDDNRRSELWLIPKAVLALAIVAVLVVIREVFFR